MTVVFDKSLRDLTSGNLRVNYLEVSPSNAKYSIESAKLVNQLIYSDSSHINIECLSEQ